MKEVKTDGWICMDDNYSFTYHIADISYIERENESFQYEIRPNYSVISLLPPELFQGIPGIDLELKKDSYIRENVVPVFISERSPGENREDLWTLLETCNMEYLNRLEWLIRTDTRYSGDSLYVINREPENIEVDTIEQLGNRSAVICRRVLEVICLGGKVVTADYTIDDNNRRMYYEMFLSLYRTEKKYIDKRRREGIQAVAAQGGYAGRKRMNVDSMKLREQCYEYERGRVTGEQAAKNLNISKSTFIRRYREYLRGCQ